MSCHEPHPSSPGASSAVVPHPTIVLVGNPNAGKSTLFNVLTGARQRVMNAPGTTVDLHAGTWRDLDLSLIDLPGTYSLDARSPDERVTAEAVAGTGALTRPRLAVVLIDATALSRSLYLLGQVADAGVGVVVALTMRDVAATRAIAIDPAALAARLGVPVIPVNPRTGEGTEQLTTAVRTAVADPPRVRLTTGGPECAGGPRCAGSPGETTSAEGLFDWVEDLVADLAPTPVAPVRTISDRIDRVLLDPWLGIAVFLAVMWTVFQVATSVATPLIDAVDGLINGTLAEWVHGWLPGPEWVGGFVVDGVLTGIGTVLSFVPLIALVFAAIAILEDSGYLARAAFVADRAMRAIGLDGRAMVPLVIGFGCNVPAIAATRTLPNARSRLLTGLLIPFTSCPARLTVYILLAGAFFPERAGTVIFAMYAASIALVVLGGLALRKTLFRDLVREPLVIALPAYQRPRLRALGLATWTRVRAFVTKAGVIIVATLAVVWVAMAIPMSGEHRVGQVPVAQSLYGQTAEAIAPVFEPAGFGDWHLTAALATGFVAKEVVVGSLAQSYAVEEPADPGMAGELGERIQATLERTSGGHPGAAALAFMVFVLAYTPCLATVAEQRRAFGIRWTLGGVAIQLTTAWLLAVAIFQIGRGL